MIEENQRKLIAFADGSVKVLYALSQEGNTDNSNSIIEHMQRWLGALIDANMRRRYTVDYFYIWQQEIEGNECIVESLDKASTVTQMLPESTFNIRG
jgi:hypothetical protein